jgi:lipopolysaccharide biosynthesis glycosyltransferase
MANIAFSLNRCIAKPLLATINSIFVNSVRPEDVNVYIVVPPGDKQYFLELINSAFSQQPASFTVEEFTPPPFLKDYLDNKFKERRPERIVSRYMQYARLFLKSIFPELGRVIYLDVDLIVLDDIEKLYNLPIQFTSLNFLAAVPQNFPCLLYFSNPFKVWDEISRFKQTFNSGVLLTDLQFWQQDVYDRLRDYFSLDARHNYRLFELGDETVFNLIFKETYLPLPNAWNCCGYGNHPWVTRWMRRSPSDMKIIHWSGGHQKPWQSSQVIFSDLWQSYVPQMKESSHPDLALVV